MPNTLQVEFDWLLNHACPLLKVEEAADILSVGRDAVTALLDEGLLRAIDIALDQSASRRELRFWRWTVLHRAIRPEERLGEVDIAKALPHARPVWRVYEAAAWLRCSDDHIWNLWDRQLIAGPNYNAGRNKTGKSRMVSRDSLIAFAQLREVE